MNLLQKRLVLMITDKNGSRYFNVSVLFKQITLYVLVGILAFIAFIVSAICVMKSEIRDIESKSEVLAIEFKKVQKNNTYLNEEIAARMNAMNLAGSKVDNLEDIIGIPKESEEKFAENLLSRIDTSAITGAQKAFIMKFIPNGYPLERYYRISASFGNRIHPILHILHRHTGIDLSAMPNTAIYATADGVVEYAANGWNGGYGNLVKISHAFGFKTYYAHLNTLVVNTGQFVKKGQLIAYSGSTGVSTGPHLHYEVRFLNNPIDPYYFLQWNMKNFDIIFQKERTLQWQSLLTLINTLMLQSKEDPPLSSHKEPK